jgi:hypothetical protein
MDFQRWLREAAGELSKAKARNAMPKFCLSM